MSDLLLNDMAQGSLGMARTPRQIFTMLLKHPSLWIAPPNTGSTSLSVFLWEQKARFARVKCGQR